MALDSNGNIYVTGFSQNSLTNLGYVTIKYAPNGTQLWASRYDSTNYPSATPAALVLDPSNGVIVTGNALTVKYDLNGTQLWDESFAGKALAVDSNANVYVAGFSQNFGTAKLTSQGSNVWLVSYTETAGPTVSQSVLVDNSNNVYVSGLDTYINVQGGVGPGYGRFVVLTSIKYDVSGNQLWKASQGPITETAFVQVGGAALDVANNLYLVSNWPGTEGYVAYKYGTDGTVSWTSFPASGNVNNNAYGLALNSSSNVLLVGQNFRMGNSGCSTIELDTNGSISWMKLYPADYSATGGAMSIAIDSANNSYVTGYSPGTNLGNDIVTIKYGPNGNQIWLQRYNGPGNGNDAGNAIAVDKNGNVYVAGYDTTVAGGTEMVLIKYSAVLLQRLANGTVLLQTEGSPGESFEIQASADLLNWLDLGSVVADTNGLMQFDDTNAPNYPARFYLTSPQ